MLVNNLIENSALRYPSKTALIARGVRYSYGELDGMSDRVAAALCSDGFRKGERAAIFLENSAEAVIGAFGVLKAGGVLVMVNPSTKAQKLSYILSNCRASALIAPWKKADIVEEACESGGGSLRGIYLAGPPGRAGRLKYASFDEIMKAAGTGPVKSGAIDADLANIIYTSGSTGAPKGVMMTHLNMMTAINSITCYLENTEHDIILNTLPMSFDYGLYQVLTAFKAGAAVVLEKTFLYPYAVIKTLISEKVTGFPVVPTISALLLQMEDLKNHSFDGLRYITNTAAALPVSHITKLRKLFPKTRIYSMYGLTECKRVSYLAPEELDRRPASVGKAMPNTEAFVVDRHGKRVGPNVVGELVVRGSHVMRGYWEMPEETAKKLRPGEFQGDVLLYTGDLFRTDDEGFLYFVAREDDIIKSRGEKVSPREIENVLYSLEGVLEAAAVGVPDPVQGQAIKAFVSLKDGCGLSEADILRHCALHLEDYLVPREIELVQALPKTETGKIRKAGLS